MQVSWLASQTNITDLHSSLSRVLDQNGVSPLYIMFEIYHSGPESSNYVTPMDQRAMQKSEGRRGGGEW